MQRLNRVGILIIALVAALALLGLNVTTALAGLGIGGLAVALAAQKTLENLIGGISLLLDRAIQVGDFCKIGDRVGTVEDIGLRSLKLRTLDQNLLVVPNGVLAQMQFENMKERPKLLLQQTFSLRIETQVEQLRFVLDGVEKMLDEDPAIESGSSRLRVANFAGAAFELELFAFVKTGDFAKFTAFRQEIILKIAGIVEGAGTRFAAPTRLTYQAKDQGVDTDKASEIVRQVSELRANNAFQFQAKCKPQQHDDGAVTGAGRCHPSGKTKSMNIPVAAFLRERKPRFFEGLDAPDIRTILAAGTQQRFCANSVIHNQGYPCRAFISAVDRASPPFFPDGRWSENSASSGHAGRDLRRSDSAG